MDKQLLDLCTQLPDALMVLADGRIIFITEVGGKLFGGSSDDLLNKELVSLSSVNQEEFIVRGLWEAEHLSVPAGSGYHTIQFTVPNGDNAQRWLEYRCLPGKWDGQSAIVGTIGDITSRKKRERKLRAAQHSQQILVANMPALVYRSGRDHYQSMEYLSLDTEELTGYKFEELMGADPVMFEDLIIPTDRDMVNESVEEGLKLHQSFEIQYRITDKAGSVKYVNEFGRAIHDQNGDFECLVGMIFDVSEKRHTDEKLLQSERMVAMGEMASGVAHDFNNVLTGILGRAQLMQFMDVPENIMNDLQLIEKIAHDGAEVVKRIQVFTRSRNVASFTPIDLNSVIRDVVDFTRPKWYDQPRARQIEIDLMTELNPIPRIKGNEGELREVFTNIILNAVDAIREKGSIRIITDQKGDKVTVAIRDDGVGIPVDIHRKIFAPFFSTKGSNGTGLGLSVARNIIQRHDGDITADNIESGGAVFDITFPKAPTLPKEQLEEKATDSVKPTRVVITNVEENVRNLMKDILEVDGHEVYCLVGSDDIEVSLADINPEIVIADISRPDTEDMRRTDQIRASHPGVLILLSSGMDDLVYQDKKSGSDLELMIRKPFNIHQLRSVMAQAMSLQKPVSD